MKLIFPTAEYAGQIAAYRQEFLDAGDSMDGTGALRRMADPMAWIEFCEKLRCRETAPDSWVPGTQLMLVRETDDRIVGMIDVRHELNAYLEQYGGNIGYSVRPSERGKGYANRMLALALPFCWDTLGLERVLITCLEENEASRRTILKNGGVYESTVLEPHDRLRIQIYWITRPT